MEGIELTLILRAQQGDRDALNVLLRQLQTSYSVVVLGLVALGAHVSRATLRVLQAIDAGRT